MKYGVVLPIWRLTTAEAERMTLRAEELGWDAPRAMREVAELAAHRWRAVAPVLGGAQVAAMEIHRHVNFGMLGLAEEILP